ncbi:MAG: GDYXXLXY domain-containing protein [Erythrobacter sp.]
MQTIARLVAIMLVPLVGLGALWGWSDHLSRQGTDWEVEIEGYDPRDLLRGHYVEFSYDWPASEADRTAVRPFDPNPQFLCFYGAAPKLDRVRKTDDPAEQSQCEHPARADLSGVYGSSSLARGRLYVGQDRAKEIERELRNRDQRGIVTVRLREDGVMTPQSIRFRPLTPEELAARDNLDGDPMVEQEMPSDQTDE